MAFFEGLWYLTLKLLGLICFPISTICCCSRCFQQPHPVSHALHIRSRTRAILPYLFAVSCDAVLLVGIAPCGHLLQSFHRRSWRTSECTYTGVRFRTVVLESANEQQAINDTYVLNCTVRPLYSGENAYATPPATAKKAPHYNRG